ncbi:MAG: hypothetical protein IJD43_12890 [Thermoguttaceae bacterium]|nr:hypothetical protein [Thermoguttaceae bacterium]
MEGPASRRSRPTLHSSDFSRFPDSFQVPGKKFFKMFPFFAKTAAPGELPRNRRQEKERLLTRNSQKTQKTRIGDSKSCENSLNPEVYGEIPGKNLKILKNSSFFP